VTRSFPRNCWYVAARSEDVDSGLGRYRVADVPLVLHRQPDGRVVALEDRCPHRGYPLSAGHTDSDLIVCGYHGMCFDGDGTCVKVPSQAYPPYGAGVRSFPVAEQAPFVWVWPGEEGRARLTVPPRLPWLSDPAWASTGLVFDVAANYLLLHDHYLDLTHVPAMHPEMLAPGLQQLAAIDHVTMSEMSVALQRTLPPAPLAGWESFATGLDRRGDLARTHHGEFLSPAVNLERWVIDPGDEDPYEQARIQAVTPTTETTTRLHWFMARNYHLERPEVGQRLHHIFETLVRQDIAVVEKIQANSEGRPPDGVRVSADTAMLKARQIVAGMLGRERASARAGDGRKPADAALP
jgi:phenylpropionate dioxygenase-like ring-hydroxylating dioxygenase large terminal subunit